MPEVFSDEAFCPRHATGGTGSALLQASLTTENLRRAFKRVRANKGAAGVDGLDIDQTSRRLATEWPYIRERLLSGTYRPSPVRRVTIPKPDGGERELGSKFFDRVNHEILIDRLSKRIDDAGVIRLVRAYLNSGIMAHGVVQARDEGTPQGGPLSPLLANVMLDEVDKELELRGHRFARYADDANRGAATWPPPMPIMSRPCRRQAWNWIALPRSNG